MPCNDITDSLKIKLDADEKVVKYALRKKTCQGEVGRKSLIGQWLKGKPAAEVISFPIDQFIKAHPTKSSKWEYLYLKHFIAVRSSLAVLLGQQSGGVDDYVKIALVEYSPEGTILETDISVEGMTAEIEACGSCAGCS